MSSKLITIFMILFMLIISTGMMTTYRYVGSKQNQDMAERRVENSVVTTDGEIKEDVDIIMSKAEIIEAIKYNEAIKNQFNRLKIQNGEDLDGSNTVEDTEKKVRDIKYSGNTLTVEEARTRLSDGNHIIAYTDEAIIIK